MSHDKSESFCRSHKCIQERNPSIFKVKGSSRRFYRPFIQIVGVQPEEGTRIPGIRKWPQEYLPKIFNPSKVDLILEVNQQEAERHTKLLAQKEGVFAGMSSGGAVSAALKVCNELEEGVVVVIICDRGDRYLSSGLF